jgi:hypothetical protein
MPMKSATTERSTLIVFQMPAEPIAEMQPVETKLLIWERSVMLDQVQAFNAQNAESFVETENLILESNAMTESSTATQCPMHVEPTVLCPTVEMVLLTTVKNVMQETEKHQIPADQIVQNHFAETELLIHLMESSAMMETNVMAMVAQLNVPVNAVMEC